jgi:hypothetical protein
VPAALRCGCISIRRCTGTTVHSQANCSGIVTKEGSLSTQSEPGAGRSRRDWYNTLISRPQKMQLLANHPLGWSATGENVHAEPAQ